MSEIDWTTWIPDGTTLCYQLKGTNTWQTGKVADDRTYKSCGETYHVVMLDTKESITFSVTQNGKSGTQGTHYIKL